MNAIVDRKYVRQHSAEVIKSFGLMSYVHSLTPSKKGLLEQMEEKFLAKGIPMPGPIGNAYRLSALLELRATRIYARMVKRFEDAPALVREFFEQLQAEEEEHARIMTLCLYTINIDAEADYIPSVRDPDIRALLHKGRQLERSIWRLSLDEVFELTEKLEASEVNNVFNKLVNQAQKSAQPVHYLAAGQVGGPRLRRAQAHQGPAGETGVDVDNVSVLFTRILNRPVWGLLSGRSRFIQQCR